MKKILSIAGVIALAATVFVACSSETADDGRNSYIDTYKLEAVDITVKAYPGYNFVSWGASKDGKEVRVLRDDGKVISSTNNNTNPGPYLFSAVDADVKNGVKYTYTAYIAADGTEVKSANDNSKGNPTNYSTEYKTYWVAKGNSKSASATAIGLDHYNSKGELTTALDLTNCTNAGDKKYVISDKNLIFKKVTDAIGAEHLYVSFPTKGYLKYETIFYKGNSFDTYYADATAATGSYSLGVKNNSTFTAIDTAQNFYKVDGTTNQDVYALGAGTWKAVVKVSAPNTGYVDSYVFAKDTVTIDAVDADTATKIVDIAATVGNQTGYIDSGKTIRVVWTPAKNSNGKDWAATNYKVYVADGVNRASANYTALDAALIKADTQKSEPVYYIDYTVTDNTAPYTFWVVLNDNGKLESTVPSVTVEKYADKPKVNFVTTGATPDTVSATFADKDSDGVSNDAVLTINVPSNTGVNKAALITVKSVKYKIVAPNDNTLFSSEKLLLDSEIKEAAVAPTADYTKYEAIVKDVAIGNSIVFLYTLQQKDHADYIDVKAANGKSNGVSTIDMANDEFAVVSVDSSKFKVTVTPGGTDSNALETLTEKENYTYNVYYARVEDEASIASITDWSEISLTWKYDDAEVVAGKWGAAKEQDVSSVFVDEYKTTLDSSGKKEKNGKGAKIVFKYVKTSKANVSSVAYSPIYTGHKD